VEHSQPRYRIIVTYVQLVHIQLVVPRHVTIVVVVIGLQQELPVVHSVLLELMVLLHKIRYVHLVHMVHIQSMVPLHVLCVPVDNIVVFSGVPRVKHVQLAHLPSQRDHRHVHGVLMVNMQHQLHLLSVRIAPKVHSVLVVLVRTVLLVNGHTILV